MPQEPYGTVPPETAWPRTTRPWTVEPCTSPVVCLPDFAVPRTVIDDAVISPPNNERSETWIEALAVVVTPAEPDTDDETEPARAMEPSAGYAKLPPTPTASGGPLTAPAEAPLWPGIETWTPAAFALGLPTDGADGAPAEPVNAKTAMNAIAIDCRPATEPEIIGKGGCSLTSLADRHEDGVVPVPPDLGYFAKPGLEQRPPMEVHGQSPAVARLVGREALGP